MGKNDFRSDKKIGDIAENAVIDIFNKIGRCAKAEKGEIGYDIELFLPYENDWIARLIEVKYDVMSARTGNVAIEFMNSSMNKASGVLATQSHYWCYAFPDGEIWICSISRFREFLNNSIPLKILHDVGDGNASILLYKKDVLLEACMYKITGLTPKELSELLIVLDKENKY
jgi:hypothetical protein